MGKEKKSYLELLQHPKWQKKRLEILEIANFECEDCGADDKSLQIHHSYYEKGLAPWEYPNESLHCLCEACHRKAQNLSTLLKRQLGKIELADRERLFGYALGLEALNYPMSLIDIFSYEVALGVANAWGLTAEEVIAALREGNIDGYTLDKLQNAKRKRLKS